MMNNVEHGAVVTKQSMQRRSLARDYSDSFKSQTRSITPAEMTSQQEENAQVHAQAPVG